MLMSNGKNQVGRLLPLPDSIRDTLLTPEIVSNIAHCADVDEACLVIDGYRILEYSYIIYISNKADDSGTFLVMKIERPPSSWNPQDEYDAYCLIRDIMRKASRTYIDPVCCGTNPKFLVTRFMSGPSLQNIFDQALLPLLVSRDKFESVVEYANDMARWSNLLRQEGKPGNVSEHIDQFLGSCDKYLKYIADHYDDAKLYRSLSDLIRRLLSLAGEDTLNLMSMVCPSRGDFTPQNFLASESGEVVGLDFEGFGFSPFNHDIGTLRDRLDCHYWQNPLAAKRIRKIWQTFLDSIATTTPEREFAVLCYLERLFWRLSFDISYEGNMQVSRLRRTVRNLRAMLRFRSRMAWLRKCPDNLSDAWQYMYEM